MRRRGDRAQDPALHHHRCWGYERVSDLHDEARAFAEDGLARGLRVQLAGHGTRAELLAQLDGLDDLGGRLDAGDLEVLPLDGFYESGPPEAQVAAYAAATARALHDGHAGLRAIADVTTLVATPEAHDRFCRYEHLVDRFMAEHPMSAMCAYDRGRLGADAVADAACLHPASPNDEVPFHLYGSPGGLALDGELDALAAERFDRALTRSLDGAHGTVEVDASGLGFADHRALLTLERHARRTGCDVVLRGADAIPRSLLDLLPLSAVLVERA